MRLHYGSHPKILLNDNHRIISHSYCMPIVCWLLHTHYLCFRTLSETLLIVMGEKSLVLKASAESSSHGQAWCHGEEQQVFANSNTLYHTLHYTFPPFLWVSATLNIFHSFNIFLSFHLLLSLIKIYPGKLLLILQDPAQIITLSETFCYPISYTTLK